MNRRQIVTVSLIAAGIAAYLPNIPRILRLHKMAQEREREYALNLKAIKLTEREMLERVRSGELRAPSYEIERMFHEQLDFNKIAVREDI